MSNIFYTGYLPAKEKKNIFFINFCHEFWYGTADFSLDHRYISFLEIHLSRTKKKDERKQAKEKTLTKNNKTEYRRIVVLEQNRIF